MNTKQAAEKWNCTERTVRDYCKSGMIPLAEKNGFNWEIPDEMEKKPPITRTRAVYLMRCIMDKTLPETKGYWSEEKLVDALAYISDVKFILDYEGSSSLEEAVKRCRISAFGRELIEREMRKKSESSFGIELSGEAGLEKGIPSAKGTFSLKGERKESE